MEGLEKLFSQNRAWAARVSAESPEFFLDLSRQQAPEYLWIGCADSRVPANQIVGLLPGEVFVHRNVANVVAHSDLNCLGVIQFAVDVLKVKHVIVCGHYACGGVRASFRRDRHGLVDNWLRHVGDVRDKHQAIVERAGSEEECIDRLCEFNVIEQVANVCMTTVVGDAWARGQKLSVHGIIYGLKDGLLNDLRFSADSTDEANNAYHRAISRVVGR